MKNVHPLRAERRKQQRLVKLGSQHPFCLFCGCSIPMLLRPVTKKFLEEHPIVGRARDATLTLALCFNCHALVTEGLLQAGVRMERDADPVSFARNAFRSLGVHFRTLSDACGRFEMHLLKGKSQ